MIHIRNLLFAPVSEELVFRSLIVAVMVSSYVTQREASSDALTETSFDVVAEGRVWSLCVLVPGWFALAHIHHLLEKIIVQKQSLAPALIGTAVQLTYTSIFGAIATYLYLRSACIVAPIVSHMICNYVGLPDVSFIFPPGDKNATEISYMFPYRHILIGVHALGLLLFLLVIEPATSPTIMGDSSIFWLLLAKK